MIRQAAIHPERSPGSPSSATIRALRGAILLALALWAPLSADAQHWGWQADPDLVHRLMAEQSTFNYDEARVPPYVLPELLPNGATPEAWRLRREEILELFREHVYGRSPERPDSLRFEVVEEDPAAMGGSATMRRVAVHSTEAGREHRFELLLFLPNAPPGPVPVFLLLNHRSPSNTDPTRSEKSDFWPAEEVIARGFGIAALQAGELAPDDREHYRSGVIRLFEGEGTAARDSDAWAALAAWAWGASRAMDYFETAPRVDAGRVAVVGHSRGGKAALWAGAQDERFALVVSNESGEGGAALSRRHYGETLGRITEVFPHWFAGRYGRYAGGAGQLPVDQHMLLALMAPRAVYVASADEDLWSDPRGEFLALAHASPVYALYGEPELSENDMPPLDRPLWVGRRGYHVRSGAHDLTRYDWARFLDFAETLWPR